MKKVKDIKEIEIKKLIEFQLDENLIDVVVSEEDILSESFQEIRVYKKIENIETKSIFEIEQQEFLC